MSDPPQPLPTAPCWSAVLKKPPASESHEALASRVFGSCRSSKGISVAVVDANAIIHGDKLAATADKFVSVKEVLEEVRDPASRRRLAFLPFPVETMEPSPDSIKKVVKFARETGDLRTLSDVDIKIIALTYMLESQIHGASHLRDRPPPLHEVKVKNLPEAEMPGWGNNVPNLAEWEALEQATEGGFNHGSRILPLKDLNNQVSMTTGSCTTVEEDLNNKVSMTTGSCTTVEEQDGGQQSFRKPKSYLAPNEEIKIEGKKMVAVGIDTSVGEDTEDVDDWHPAVSRSTHRRYLRRKARREFLKASEGNGQPSEEANVDAATVDGEDDLSDSTHCAEQKSSQETRCNGEHSESDAQLEGNIGEFDISTTQEHVRSDIDTSKPLQLDEEDYNACAVKGSDHPKIGEDSFLDANMVTEEDEVGTCIRTLDNLEITSQSDESVATSFVDDGSSEQSWMLRSLSDSNVACITSDYAMQNVILQIGLRLLAPGGMQIRQLHRWVLKCHACNKVTREIGRIFCPKCGNGGTLRKVSVTVGENGIVLAARRPRIILRGTKFSLPLPQGGREAITKNLILREDQLPHKLLYPKSKKKPNKKDEDFPSSDDIFSHSADNKRAPLKPPVRKALAVFSGKRNPNDNHFARHKR